MRPLLISTLLLTLPLEILSAGAGEPDKQPVPLQLRSAAEVGPNAAAVKGPAGEVAIEVAGGDAASTTTLLVVDKPAISSPDYVVRGRVKYDGVSGDGYLELLNGFGKQGTFFTRAINFWGPMKKLTGSSDWREFELPFHAAGMKPERLTLNVVLHGAGKVTVAEPLTVAPINVAGQWWTEMQSGLIGGGLGSFIGILGGLTGAAAAWGKSRRLTLSLVGFGLAISGLSLVAGLVALLFGQPWHVYYPLLLIGVIGVSVWGLNLRPMLRRFQTEELRRMTATDVV